MRLPFRAPASDPCLRCRLRERLWCLRMTACDLPVLGRLVPVPKCIFESEACSPLATGCVFEHEPVFGRRALYVCPYHAHDLERLLRAHYPHRDGLLEAVATMTGFMHSTYYDYGERCGCCDEDEKVHEARAA